MRITHRLYIYRAKHGTDAFRKEEKQHVFLKTGLFQIICRKKYIIARVAGSEFTCLLLLGCETRFVTITYTTALRTLVMESAERLETTSTKNHQNVYGKSFLGDHMCRSCAASTGDFGTVRKLSSGDV